MNRLEELEKIAGDYNNLLKRHIEVSKTLEQICSCLQSPGDCSPPEDTEKWEVRNTKMIVRRMVEFEKKLEEATTQIGDLQKRMVAVLLKNNKQN
jgi:hypothetical protein